MYIVIATVIRPKTNIDGDEALPVFSTNNNERGGASPADKLAAVEYNTDKTVQRRWTGNISANITGTVA